MLPHYVSSHCCNNLVGRALRPAGLAGEGLGGRNTLPLLLTTSQSVRWCPWRWGRNTPLTLLQGIEHTRNLQQPLLGGGLEHLQSHPALPRVLANLEVADVDNRSGPLDQQEGGLVHEAHAAQHGQGQDLWNEINTQE